MKTKEMREMTNEELNVIAMEKNRKNRFTQTAIYAQQLIWERRIEVKERLVDDYEGWVDPYDEGLWEWRDFFPTEQIFIIQ